MKLNEIEATKGKSGNYYGIDEILGMDIEILEDISSNTDIREYKTKKDNLYYCMLVHHTEDKDLHLTKAALLAVAAVLPKTESWKGYKIKINRTGKGFNTSYLVNVLGKGVSSYGSAAPPQNPSQVSDPAGQIIEGLKKLDKWEDGAFWMQVGKVQPNLSDAMGIVEKLKQMGRIIRLPDGTWKAA